MAGHYSGLATRILQINPLALYTHCASHRLSLFLLLLVISSVCPEHDGQCNKGREILQHPQRGKFFMRV